MHTLRAIAILCSLAAPALAHHGWTGYDEKNTLTLTGVIRAKCVRTLEWFDLPLEVKDFTCHVDEVLGDEVDLTPQIREDILILLPPNPVSPEAKPLKEAKPRTKKASGSKVWGDLDKLKLK